jgi:hypothetical protein
LQSISMNSGGAVKVIACIEDKLTVGRYRPM